MKSQGSILKKRNKKTWPALDVSLLQQAIMNEVASQLSATISN
jgi:hypothetical protein